MSESEVKKISGHKDDRSYENLIALIRNETSKIKFRKFKEADMNFTKMADHEITNTFRSEVLNNEGIIVAYNTFM